VRGPLHDTLHADGIWNVIDLRMYPWGNAYYDSPLLDGCPSTNGTYPYNRDRYTCWAERCSSTTSAPEQCFNGTKLCQHGPDECYANSVEVCSTAVYPPTLYSDFIYCFEESCEYDGADPTNSTCNTTVAFLEGCASYAGIAAAPILECFDDAARRDLLDQDAARATAALGTFKEGTPWVLLNGVPLDDVNSLLEAICDAWSAQDGAMPPGCPGASADASYDWATWQESLTLAVGLGGGLLCSLGLCALCMQRAKANERRAPLLEPPA